MPPAPEPASARDTRRRLFWTLALTTVAVDQITKILIGPPFVSPMKAVVLVPNLLRIVAHRSNPKGAFGLGPSGPWFYIAAAVIGIGVVTYVLYRAKAPKRLLQVGLALVWGGALGNVIDRGYLGAVRDFIDLHWKDKFHWPTFNIADTAICIGVAVLFAETLLYGQSDPERAEQASVQRKGGTH